MPWAEKLGHDTCDASLVNCEPSDPAFTPGSISSFLYSAFTATSDFCSLAHLCDINAKCKECSFYGWNSATDLTALYTALIYLYISLYDQKFWNSKN